jgi:outer membrane protein assembly factor BamB
MTRRLLMLGLAFAGLGFARAGDWPQFRGPNLSGVSEETGLPERWGPGETIRWAAELPGRGVSCPVVVGGRVYLTANSGMTQSRLHVLCFDVVSGRRLWERQLWATGQTLCNPKTCMAAPTPAADGRIVYALFGTGDLAALDADGDLRWLRSLQADYPRMTNHVGRGASPVLHNDVLIVPMESQGESYLLGIDTATGRNRWKVERPAELCYTTPVLHCRGGTAEILVQSPRGLDAYDPATGAHRWSYDGEQLADIPSPVAAGDLIFAAGRGLVALRPGGSGPPAVVWKTPKLSTATPTPLVHNGRVYTVNASGILVCGDAAQGREMWRLRLKGPFTASPVLADGKLYLVNEDGVTSVMRPGDTPEVVATNDLQEPMLATPAVARGCLFLRSDKHLFCVGRAKAQD